VIPDPRHVCPRCGSAFAPDVFATFRKVAWERRDGVICEARDCVCAGGSRAFLIPHPEMGADVVLFALPGPSGVPHVEAGHPLRFVRVMADYYVAEDGAKFRRFPAAGPAKEKGGMGDVVRCFRREVRGDELARLRAWAKGMR
jgi:hypothetical protein